MRLVEAKRKQWYLIAVFLFFGNLYLACRITNVFGAALIVLAYSVVLPFDVFLNAGASKVLCRTMRVRKSKRQTESASMLCNQYFLPHVFAGGAVSAILLLTSDLLMTKVFHVNMCTSILQILALSIVFRCLFSWAAGGVRGEGRDLPIAALHVGRQVLTGVLILLLARSRMNYGEKISAFFAQENFASLHGGIGIALSMLLAEGIVSVVAAVLYLLILRQNSGGPKGRKRETMFGAVGFVTKNRIVTMLTLFLCALMVPVSFAFYHKAAEYSESSLTEFGVYGGLYAALIGALTVFLLHRLIPVAAKCTNMLKKDEIRFAKFSFRSGVTIGTARGMFYAVFAFIMARMISNAFGGEDTVLLEPLIKYGTAVGLLLSLILYFAEVLLLSGNEKVVLCAAALGDAVYLISLAVLLNTELSGSMALMIALLIVSACVCLLLGFAAGKVLRFRFDLIQSLALPFVAAVLAGIVSLVLGKLLAPHLGQALTLAICFVVSQFLYWIVTFVLHIFRLDELVQVPGGKIIAAIGQMFHLI